MKTELYSKFHLETAKVIFPDKGQDANWYKISWTTDVMLRVGEIERSHLSKDVASTYPTYDYISGNNPADEVKIGSRILYSGRSINGLY